MKPILAFNDTFLKVISPFMKIAGITIFPFVIMKSKFNWNDFKVGGLDRERGLEIYHHERIHIEQQLETLILPFYVIYFTEFFIKFLLTLNFKRAYLSISFEQEANQYESLYSGEESLYIKGRTRYNWIKHIFSLVNI